MSQTADILTRKLSSVHHLLLTVPRKGHCNLFFFLSYRAIIQIYRAINEKIYKFTRDNQSVYRAISLNYRAIISQFIAVVMNKTDKIREGQIQIGDKHNYRPLSQPMVKETHSKVLRLITDLHRENHIDDMTRKWLFQTPNLKHLIHNSKQTLF